MFRIVVYVIIGVLVIYFALQVLKVIHLFLTIGTLLLIAWLVYIALQKVKQPSKK
jgi:hypothetical protein